GLAAPSQAYRSASWALASTDERQRLPDGKFLAEGEKLRELAGPNAVGEGATGQFRWYDKPAQGTPNPTEAYEGEATVQFNRQNTGNDQIGGWSVTLTGRGKRREIPNPYTGSGS